MSTIPNGTQLLTPALVPEDQTNQSAELSASEQWPMPFGEKGLGDHPLWQEFLDALQVSRQADIAEANRLADLEMDL